MAVEGVSHIGHSRPDNQDDLGWDTAAGVAVVADGLGGHPAGEKASQLAVETVLETIAAETYAGSWLTEGGDPSGLLLRAHQRLLDHGHQTPEDAGLATTAVVVAWDQTSLAVAHCGDSRAYRFSGGYLECLTADHNAAREAIEAGRLTPEQAQTSPERHQLTRALGIGPSGAPGGQLRYMMPAPGDLFLLCTDGLHGELDDAAISRILHDSGRDLGAASRALVDAALEAGGHDNVTALLVEV